VRHPAQVHRDAIRELLIKPQQPHRERAVPKYANLKSDAMTAATRAAPRLMPCQSMMSSNTSDILPPRSRMTLAGRVAVVEVDLSRCLSANW
jgi:hypothetical protein